MATRELKISIANFFKGFLNEIVPTTTPLQWFKKRPIEKRFAITVGRLVDQAEEMLAKWREQGINGAISPLPVFLMGFDKSYNSTGLEKGQCIAMSHFTICDNDGNYFNVRTDKHDQRVQIVLYAPDHETAFSLASQFKLYCARYENRHCYAYYPYNGKYYAFALTLEDNNIFGASQQIPDQDNLTVLVFDLTFNCNTPYFLGDVVTGEPYLSVVNAVIIDEFQYKQQVAFYHTCVKTPEADISPVGQGD